MTEFPKRLIEVDLPIKRISAHARREKSIRHGHISTLHIWWARRPLAACRAVLCAALWPDPADEHCPLAFRQVATEQILRFAHLVVGSKSLATTCSAESFGRWNALSQSSVRLDIDAPSDQNLLRCALLDFIADFANWDNSIKKEYLETSRALTEAAHEATGGLPGTRPLVVDSFSGGGSIPLEALRVGADAFASDLNPVAVLLNKVLLEYIPRYGQRLVREVRKWGKWIEERIESELSEFYPKDVDGAWPVAYLWARTIICEGPKCGGEVPLLRSLWLSKKKVERIALRMVPDAQEGQVGFEIIQHARPKDVGEGTARLGSVTCPICGFTTPVESVRRQLGERRGGTADARLVAVVVNHPAQRGRSYRLPTEYDLVAVQRAASELERQKSLHRGPLSLVPDEEISLNEVRRISVPLYGMTTWGDLFTPRQSLVLATLVRLVRSAGDQMGKGESDGLAEAVQTVLGLAISRFSDISNALCMWESTKTQVRHAFTRQALPMLWDFAEPNSLADAAGNYTVTLSTMIKVLERSKVIDRPGTVSQVTATRHPLPDDIADAFVTDPPYYDAVPYAYLSDFFYVWLRRSLGEIHMDLLARPEVPKEEEIVVDRPHRLSDSTKDISFYERELTKAFSDGRRLLRPDGIGTIVFASKTTMSWEAFLQAVTDAGWTVTASWPIDTELRTRLAARGQARLASSIHLVCRPHENPDGSPCTDDFGDWRDVLAELPKRIHDWMPRLAQEGVVGADAIFACLGPALEIFSRYSRVERASGEQVVLREYLEYVWAAIAREALNMIFEGADATGFEADARLTAIWLWTLSTAPDGPALLDNGRVVKSAGYTLEYDAARKIAQGLGAHLEQLETVVEIKGDQARLLPVAERTQELFGKAGVNAPRGRRPASVQMSFFEVEAEESTAGADHLGTPPQGRTVLDRVHQAMLLFATDRSEALRQFLVEEGVGQEARFWKLAQALSALYPTNTDEKRWVDGVLARKKGLGF